MITYLHHTDPELPHYRQPEWNFQRGAAATVDRDFLGWMGRFFLHDVAHYHVVHHFFPKMPFCQSFFLSSFYSSSCVLPSFPSLATFRSPHCLLLSLLALRERTGPFRWARCFRVLRTRSVCLRPCVACSKMATNCSWKLQTTARRRPSISKRSSANTITARRSPSSRRSGITIMTASLSRIQVRPPTRRDILQAS